jgi:hypothetical protein
MDFKLHNVGLIKYEMEEIVRALDLSAHISLTFEQNLSRYGRTKTISDRLKTLIIELETTK